MLTGRQISWLVLLVFSVALLGVSGSAHPRLVSPALLDELRASFDCTQGGYRSCTEPSALF
jgi:hypothetical protein